MMRLLDTYAPRFDITGTQVVLVDAEPPIVRKALDHHRPTPLGLGECVARPPTLLEARGHERVYSLIWQLADGHVKVVWDIQVDAGGEAGSVVATTTRFVATDEQARAHLLDAWGLIGTVSTALTKRALTRIKRLAEDHEPGLEALVLAA
jgi:hypothetical protein